MKKLVTLVKYHFHALTTAFVIWPVVCLGLGLIGYGCNTFTPKYCLPFMLFAVLMGLAVSVFIDLVVDGHGDNTEAGV